MLVSKITSLLNQFLSCKQLRQIHGVILTNGLTHLEGLIIRNLISSNSNTRYLELVVNQLKQPDMVTVTLVMRYLCKHSKFREVFELYVKLHTLGLVSPFVVASGLKACGRLGYKEGGVMVHGRVYRYGLCGDVYVETSLVGFYTKSKDMGCARKVFDEMSERNVVTWNTMIDGYLRCGDLVMAEGVFSGLGDKDVVSWNSMVSGYARSGDMEKALRLFEEMPTRNVGSWNAMISGYVERGEVDLARRFYDSMDRRNSISCITMIGGYAKCGDAESAKEVFGETREKDCLLYNAMIACYAKNGRAKEALRLFDEMVQPNVNIQPDKMTLATVISACSQLGDLSFGLWVEEFYMKQMGITMDDHICTALIDLYAKCGSIDKAFKLFHKLNTKDVVAYTAMILGCGINGKEQIAIRLFNEMMEANVRPNLVTFSGLLTALSHVGMVEESYRCFTSMKRFGLVPTPDHYSLMVEILGRAGRLEEGHKLIKDMPMQAHAGVWGALLLACSTHNNVELGEIAAQHCFELEADSSGYGSLLANIYAGVGRWEDAKRLRKCIHEKGLVKVPGSSWMDNLQE